MTSKLRPQISSTKLSVFSRCKNYIWMIYLVLEQNVSSVGSSFVIYSLRLLQNAFLNVSRRLLLPQFTLSFGTFNPPIQRYFFTFLKYSIGVNPYAFERMNLCLSLRPIISRCSSLLMICCSSGAQCSRGQENLKWLNFTQNQQGCTSSSSGMLRILSRSKQQCSQSMLLVLKISMNLLYGSMSMTENCSDLISQRGRCLEIKSRLVRQGAPPSSTFIRSVISSLKAKPCFLQAQPIFPNLSMTRLKSSSMALTISCGCAILDSICSAKLQRVCSSSVRKKTSCLRIVLLASRRQLVLSATGSSSMNYFSSSWLNFLRRLELSSMQLVILKARSSGTQFWSVSFLKILNFWFRSWSQDRMLLIMAPTQFTLQAIMMQLNVSMKIRKLASRAFVATISPNPTVNMMLTAQQQDHTYCVAQGLQEIPLAAIQLSEGLRLAMADRTRAMRWAQQKLTRNTLANSQYCSLQTLRIRQTSIFYIFLRHCGSLKMMKRRRQLITSKLLAMSRNRMTRLTKSIQKWLVPQKQKIYLSTSTFFPAYDLTEIKLSTIYRKQKTRLPICSMLRASLLRIKSSKVIEIEQTTRSVLICMTDRKLNRLSTMGGSSIPGRLSRLSLSQSENWVQLTGGWEVEVRVTFRMKLSRMLLIFCERTIISRLLFFSKMILLFLELFFMVATFFIWVTCRSICSYYSSERQPIFLLARV